MPEPTTAPVTAEDLRDRIKAVIEDTDCPHEYHEFDACSGCRADAVMAALAGDPGDLPARMATELARHWIDGDASMGYGDGDRCTCGEMVKDWQAHLAAAAMSVRWEDAASLAAENARLRAALTESQGNTSAYHEHMVTAQSERDRHRAGMKAATRHAELAEVQVATEKARADKAEKELEQYRARLAARITEEAGLSWQELLDRAERLAGPHPTFDAFRLVDGQRIAAWQRAETAEAEVDRLQKERAAWRSMAGVEEVEAERDEAQAQDDDKDVPAAVERLMRHLSEHEADVQRLRQSKSEALEKAEAQVADDRRHVVIVAERDEARKRADWLRSHAEWLSNERDAIAAAARKALEVRQTHHKTAHPARLIDPACDFCQVLLVLSRSLPARPDDPEEIRRLAQATTEETNDG